MKHLLLASLLLAGFGSQAQSTIPLVPRSYPLTQNGAPLYRALRDSTTGFIVTTILRPEEVLVTGQAPGNWLAVEWHNKTLYVPARYVARPSSTGPNTPRLDPFNLPLNEWDGEGGIAIIGISRVAATQKATDLARKGRAWFSAYAGTQALPPATTSEAPLIAQGTYQSKLPGAAANSSLRFTFRLEVKDGRYRYSLYDFSRLQGSTVLSLSQVNANYHEHQRTEENGELLKALAEDVTYILHSLDQAMRQEGAVK